MDRESCIAFIEQTYFGNVRGGNVDAVMACFTPDASLIIRHGDNPERFFGVESSDGVTPLQAFYGHLCGNYDAWFGDFEHYIDSGEQRAATRFTVRLVPKPDGLYADTGTQELVNCNFFEIRDALISHMIIYYANPKAGVAAAGHSATPTGYPKAD
jgi:hypothetical protein